MLYSTGILLLIYYIYNTYVTFCYAKACRFVAVF